MRSEKDGIGLLAKLELCNNSIMGGYRDWRLPDIDELTSMYTIRSKIGGFESSYTTESRYWSSTSVQENYTQTVRFGDGALYSAQNSQSDHSGRCVRTLTDTE